MGLFFPIHKVVRVVNDIVHKKYQTYTMFYLIYFTFHQQTIRFTSYSHKTFFLWKYWISYLRSIFGFFNATIQTEFHDYGCCPSNKLEYTNNGIGATNICNILGHKKCQSCIPSYFSSLQVCALYFLKYILLHLRPTRFDYKQIFIIDNLVQNPSTCSWYSFNYSPAGPVINLF